MTASDDPMSDAEGALHVLEYHWEGFEPHLVCYDRSEDDVCEFELTKLGFSVSRDKRCIGSWYDEGNYIPCPKASPVTRFSQCAECSEESFLPKQECLFEPLCDGELCDIDFCRREHMIYVAFYDTRMKIGMTSTRRIERRLIEQGADAYSILGEFKGRRKARSMEKDISERLRIPQFYRQEVLLRNLSRPVDRVGIEGRLEALRMTLGKHPGLALESIVWLEKYPIRLPLPTAPKLQESAGHHSGEYLGIKGKWLVFESGGLRALNLSDLPSRFIARRVV